MKEFYQKYRTCYSSFGSYGNYTYNDKLYTCPVHDLGESKAITPIYFNEDRSIKRNPIIFMNPYQKKHEVIGT